MLDIKAWEPGYTRDPHPYLAELRQACPVSQVVVDALPLWLVTGYEQAREALTDSALSNDPDNAGPRARAAAWTGAGASSGLMKHMLRTDAPDHSRLRRLIAKAFTPRRLEGLRPVVQRLADEHCDRLAGRDRADLLADYARPVAVGVITALFGVAAEDLADFVKWANVFISADGDDADRVSTALKHLHEHLVTLIRERRRALEGRPTSAAGADTLPHGDTPAGADTPADADTLLDGLIAARDGGDRLAEPELVAMAFLLLGAGFETTMNLIATGTYLLLRHPAQHAAVLADPSLLPNAIEEFLRYEPPIKANVAVRYATADTLIGGVTVRAGDTVMVHYGAANRDPARFPDPDRMDIARQDNAHLAFSLGAHFCIGAALGRSEARIALATLLARFPDLRLAVPAEDLRWRPSRFARGLQELPVTLGRSQGV